LIDDRERSPLHIAQHIRFELTSSPFGTSLPSVATSYMLGMLFEIPNRAFKRKIYNVKRQMN